MRLSGPGRTARLLMVAGAAVVVGGCSSGYGLAKAGPSASPVSTAARQNLAGRVHFIMLESGIPLQNGHVGCSPNADFKSDTCYGETAITPVTKVEGDFTASSPHGGPGGCPGTLTVKYGKTLVTTMAENPCR